MRPPSTRPSGAPRLQRQQRNLRLAASAGEAKPKKAKRLPARHERGGEEERGAHGGDWRGGGQPHKEEALIEEEELEEEEAFLVGPG